jgi:hypothetical protein
MPIYPEQHQPCHRMSYKVCIVARCMVISGLKTITAVDNQFAHAAGLKAKLTHWHYDTYLLEWLEPQSWFSFWHSPNPEGQ